MIPRRIFPKTGNSAEFLSASHLLSWVSGQWSVTARQLSVWCRSLVGGQSSVMRRHLSVLGRQLSAVSGRVSVVSRHGSFLLAVSCQLSVVSCVSCSTSPKPPSLDQIAGGEARVVDVGYALNDKSPYWPGGTYRPFQFETIATLEKEGVFSGAFSMPEHLGTHVDAPNHFELGQPSVDELELKDLVAPLVVVDIRQACEANADYRLSQQDVEAWEKQHGNMPKGAVVFALTGWGKYWNDYERYKNQDALGRMHFPGFSPEAARFLVEKREVKGLGIDTLSVDYGLSTDFRVHHIVHGRGGYHVENAARLDEVPASGAWLIAAPIKIEKGSGGPTRVWAVFSNRD